MPRVSLSVVGAAFAAFAAVPAAGGAQEATPLASPVAADPADCRIEPRPAAFYVEAVREALASSAPAATFPPEGGTITPTPIAVSEEGSQPTDAATAEAVAATVREYVACANAGDLPRIFALYTEQAARTNVAFLLANQVAVARMEGAPAAVLEAELIEAYSGLATATPGTPVPEANRVAGVEVVDVRRLADGRVVAEVVAAGVEERSRLVLAEDGGRFLIVGTLASPGTATPVVTPAG